MENKRWRAIRSNLGFYGTLAVCLLVAGISGYYLLKEDTPAPVSLTEELPAQAPVTETPVISQPEEKEVVETLSPKPVEAQPMPEVEIDDTPVVAEAPCLIVAPLKGEVLAVFSVDHLTYNETLEDWRTHEGVDISAKPGTTVMAACSGTVSLVTDDPLMGTMVVIDHDGGYQTTYANLQATPTVSRGDTVSAGQILGAVGTTAAAESAQSPHLHFAVTKDGIPMDPNEFLEH